MVQGSFFTPFQHQISYPSVVWFDARGRILPERHSTWEDGRLLSRPLINTPHHEALTPLLDQSFVGAFQVYLPRHPSALQLLHPTACLLRLELHFFTLEMNQTGLALQPLRQLRHYSIRSETTSRTPAEPTQSMAQGRESCSCCRAGIEFFEIILTRGSF
jgi:hypothetical protein